MRRTLFVMTLAAAFVLLGGVNAFAQASAPSSTWSVTDCQGCHDKALGPMFSRSKHAGLELSCAQCHQNVGEHSKAQMAGDSKGPVPSMKGLKANDINATCLTCHEKDGQSSYLSSMHARRNVACTSCHSVHNAKSPNEPAEDEGRRRHLLHVPPGRARTVAAHVAPPRSRGQDELLELPQPARGRPAQDDEGRLGQRAVLHLPRREARPVPVRACAGQEDCVSCHEPHGSNHSRLLIQKVPNLCWNCHLTGSGHFGSGDNFSTEKGVPIAPPGSPSGFPTVNSRFVGRSCRKCHVNVHGSNSPSGAFFVR